MDKKEIRKEKFKLALSSTFKVISEKQEIKSNLENKDINTKIANLVEIDELCHHRLNNC